MRQRSQPPPGQDTYWDRLRKELRATALRLCKEEGVNLWHRAEDFAQEGIIVALKFIDDRTTGRTVTTELQETLRDQARGYSKRAVKNDFYDALRELRKESIVFTTDEIMYAALYLLPDRGRVVTPEDHASADDLVRRIAHAAEASRSEIYHRFAEAIAEFVRAGDFGFNTKELVEATQGLTSNQRRDFAHMLSARMGLSPSHVSEED